MTKRRRAHLMAFALVLVSAGARLPLERALTKDLRDQELLPPRLETGVLSRMTQDSLVATLGGLRSLLASYYEVDAFTNFIKKPPRWDLVNQQYARCCQLQPRVWRYWEMHSWMLASNASEFYGSEGGAVKGLEAEERKRLREKGLEICFEGIKHNPETYRGYRQAADMLAFANAVVNPNPDHERAAELYLKASLCADADVPPSYPRRFLYRFHLYERARCPGTAAEIYPKLRKLYEDDPREDFPTTVTFLKRFEEELQIPLLQRCQLRQRPVPKQRAGMQ